MEANVSKESLWLQKLVGDWVFEAECMTEPGQPPVKTRSSNVARSLGGLWTLIEGEGESPDGTLVKSILTLGYDPAKQRFVGSFIASCMTHLWTYDGTLDEAGKVLTLDTEGPNFSGDGSMSKYQDIVEIVDDNHWILRSQSLGEDGKWVQFMEGHYRPV